MRDPLRVVLADDQVLFRQAVAALLNARPGIEVVGEASDGLDAIAVARATLPDVILMDIHMPNCGGLEAVRVIAGEMPHIQIVMLTISDHDADLFESIKNGAVGYLLKDLDQQQLFLLLDGLKRGEAAISGKLATRILREMKRLQAASGESTPSAPGPGAGQQAELLTAREVEVLELLARGQSNKEIGDTLCVTENTVKIHLRNVMEKLHLANRVQAAVYAVRAGLAQNP